MKPSDCRTASDVTELARRMFGSAPFGPGVIHVTALWESPSGRLETIRIGPGSPKSEHDLFSLSFARARADAIIVTGKVLRDEPELRYELAGPAAPALQAWRNQTEPPRLIVLTSGRGLNRAHPAFHGWAQPVIFTSRDVEVNVPGVVVARHDNPSLGAAIEWAQHHGARTVSIEAGPSTSRVLYEEPVVVDELMLSVFHGDLAAELRGKALFDPGTLRDRLPRSSPEHVVHEPSGRWSFRRRAR